MNEFIIRNGFISNDTSFVLGTLSATTISATTITVTTNRNTVNSAINSSNLFNYYNFY